MNETVCQSASQLIPDITVQVRNIINKNVQADMEFVTDAWTLSV